MGFIVLLKFALLCIDFLAWPVIALGYPLFASIRAIETGSLYHMRKLAIYWTLFSLISLFEYAFVKIIEWIPFWSSIKLVAIFWLVVPRFHGSYYAYQNLVRPFLVVNLQQVIDSLYKRKEEQTHEKERFLDVVERYIKENGCEDLEKVIASNVSYTVDHKEPGNSQKDTQVLIEPDEKNVAAAAAAAAAASEQKDKEIFEAHKKIAVIEAKPHARPVTAIWVPKETTTYAAARTKDVTPTEPISENRQLTTTRKAEWEWTCPLCQVATTCESNLNDHLRGKKHKSMCESLKLSKLSGLDTGPSSTIKPSPEAGKNQVWRRIPEKNS
ncbi:hypothetical protein CASFOL_038882 [Castilleja foliolosa]|uniref:HVA22-like protein n=1 Tax=Castilleja foliolosa TaxID=1961234 RepID=A0ABD3BJ73_9LAMI